MSDDNVEQYAERLADQLLADLKSGVLQKIGLDEIEHYVAAAHIALPTPRPSIRAVTNWTVKFVVEKAGAMGGKFHPVDD